MTETKDWAEVPVVEVPVEVELEKMISFGNEMSKYVDTAFDEGCLHINRQPCTYLYIYHGVVS